MRKQVLGTILFLLLLLSAAAPAAPTQEFDDVYETPLYRMKIHLEYYDYKYLPDLLHIEVEVKAKTELWVIVDYTFWDGSKWSDWKRIIKDRHLYRGRTAYGFDFVDIPTPKNSTRCILWIVIQFANARNYQVIQGEEYYNSRSYIVAFPWVKGQDIISLEKDIKYLRDRVSELTRQVTELKLNISSMRMNLSSMRRKLKWLGEEVEFWKNETLYYKYQYLYYLNMTNTLRSENKKLCRENTHLKKQIEDLSAQLTACMVQTAISTVVAIASVATAAFLWRKQKKQKITPP